MLATWVCDVFRSQDADHGSTHDIFISVNHACWVQADESTELYSGDLKAPQLREFLITFSSAPPDASSSDSGPADKEPKEQQVGSWSLQGCQEVTAVMKNVRDWAVP